MKNLLFSLAVVAALFTSCKEDCTCPEEKPDNSLSGDITGNLTLDSSIEYLLDGTLRVKDGGVLTIPAGTTINASKGFSKYLIVERGGKIMADGTAELPITFTSAEASPAAADWGGIIINGYANISGSEAGTEGSTEVDPNILYGGTNDTDNSGMMKYVIIEYSGAKSSANVEHNGLTLNAVGNGTTLENIFVKDGADDGIEFFGGAVNVSNLLVVNSDDDMFDITQGWTGELKNAYGIWEAGYTSNEGDPRGIEADGNLDGLGPDHVNQSNFKITNVTIENNSEFLMHDAIKIRRGATANVTNALVKGGQTKDVVDFVDGKGNANSATMVSYKVDGTTFETEVKLGDTPAENVESNSGNTGADASAFDWTGYSL